MNPSLDNPVCMKCGLHTDCKSPFMKSAGCDNPRIIVCGESPGEIEDLQGQPFVGRSGELLRDALEALDIDLDDVVFTNVVRCRPADNKITKRAIDYCKQFTLDEIDWFANNDDKLEQVWLMGNSPLQGILGESGITSWAGVKVIKDGLTFIPMYHPAYILRDMSRFDEWVDTMDKALSGDNDNPERYEVVIPKTLDEVYEMFRDLEQYDEVSFDTETSTLDPFAADALILSVSFARPGRSYSLVLEHPDTWWNDQLPPKVKGVKKELKSELFQVEELIAAFLEEHKPIGHNIKFDQNQITGILGSEFKAGGDTMIISHLIDSRPGIHGLKHLAGLHLGMYEYEQELTDYAKQHKEANVKSGGSYATVPLEILLPYGAMDAEATLRLHPILFEQLSEKQKNLYAQALLPASDTLARMQHNGIKIDRYIAERYVKIYKIVQQRAFEEILVDKKVKRLIKDRCEVNPKFSFNPNSSQQVSDLYFNYFGMSVQGVTETGKASTNAKLMEPMEAKYPIVGKVRYYKLLSKMLGTYLEPACSEWLSADGRVRCTYNLHGTVTGRLSAEHPNLQNIPNPEKEPGTLLEALPIKNIFMHSFDGGCLMNIDYSGMELRVFASLANCKKMMDILYSGRDPHAMVALLSFTKKDIDKITDSEIKELPKPVRWLYKQTSWLILYGGDWHTLATSYKVPEDEAEETVKMYLRAFPEVSIYQDKCVSNAKKQGYLKSAFGRKESFPYITDLRDKGRANADARAAKNFPVQSAASDTLVIALSIIDAEMQKAGFRSMLVNTVHDSILLDCHPDEIDQVAMVCKDVMENVAKYAKVYMPAIDFSWLRVPLKVDIEVGTHYGTLEEYHAR